MRKALEWLGGSFLVYAVLAAHSAACSTVPGETEAQGGDSALANSGQPSSGGIAATPTAGKPSASGGAGGLLDPVPPAMAAGNGGDAAVGPAPVTYTTKAVACSSTVRIGVTDFPAATLAIDPPSVTTGIATMHTTPYPGAEGGWLQGSPGALVQPDGSEIAVICTKAVDIVTFYVPG